MTSKPLIPDVLAARYASPDLARLWSPEYKVVAERRLWLAVLRAQAELGVAVPEQAIGDYDKVVDQVDLASIAERERVTRHDVKARIEEFNALAGHEQVHKGMTSRDLTENVEQLQVRDSLLLARDRVVALLARLAALATAHEATVLAGRSHNVAAQATTLGKRFASAADELLVAYRRLEELIARYPLRGVKGPVGTAQDMLDLLGGDVVRPASHRPLGVGGGQAGQPDQRRDHPVADDLQRGADLQLLDVLGQVAGGHALVHLLETGEGVELLDPGLDVVPGDLLPLGDAVEVDVGQHPFVGGHHGVQVPSPEVHSQVALLGEHGHPEQALGDDLVRRRPHLTHLLGGVAGGEHVGYDHDQSCFSAAVAAMSVR